MCRQRHYIHEESHWLPGIEEVEDRVRNVEEQLESENINVTNCYCDARDLNTPSRSRTHTDTEDCVDSIHKRPNTEPHTKL
ncbi:hypothetical protein DPMN_178730 [Dreissena polymorpha]|uniref:Uncharacterized protein n=1 Tax=Dreissena polymorpha TaxID=45954 RepID=A0A9D4IK59_DREPO|nr:hypothetical protein DPMN_178730 [Dreissena polymorpha]